MCLIFIFKFLILIYLFSNFHFNGGNKSPYFPVIKFYLFDLLKSKLKLILDLLISVSFLSECKNLTIYKAKSLDLKIGAIMKRVIKSKMYVSNVLL